MRNVGVCGTDVKIRADRMGLGVIPLIMGHEIAGEVAEVAPTCAASSRATASW